MRLETHHAVHHLRAHRFERFSPVDVGLFVKTCFELDHRQHLFAPAHGLAQQIQHLGIGAGAVDGLLDGQHMRVVDGLAQKSQDAIKALKRLVDEHVALAQLRQDRAALLHLLRPARR